MLQSGWNLGQLHDVTGGSYLETQPSYPGYQSPKATSSAAAAHFKPMPETMYNQVQYRARYTHVVQQFLEGLSQGVSAQDLPIMVAAHPVACGKNCVELF